MNKYKYAFSLWRRVTNYQQFQTKFNFIINYWFVNLIQKVISTLKVISRIDPKTEKIIKRGILFLNLVIIDIVMQNHLC